jgi:hypothetical protein
MPNDVLFIGTPFLDRGKKLYPVYLNNHDLPTAEIFVTAEEVKKYTEELRNK